MPRGLISAFSRPRDDASPILSKEGAVAISGSRSVPLREAGRQFMKRDLQQASTTARMSKFEPAAREARGLPKRSQLAGPNEANFRRTSDLPKRSQFQEDERLPQTKPISRGRATSQTNPAHVPELVVVPSPTSKHSFPRSPVGLPSPMLRVVRPRQNTDAGASRAAFPRRTVGTSVWGSSREQLPALEHEPRSHWRSGADAARFDGSPNEATC